MTKAIKTFNALDASERQARIDETVKLASRVQARAYSKTEYYETVISRKFRNCFDEESDDESESSIFLHVTSSNELNERELKTYKFNYVTQSVDLLNCDCCIFDHVDPYAEFNAETEGMTFEQFEKLAFGEGDVLDFFHYEAMQQGLVFKLNS